MKKIVIFDLDGVIIDSYELQRYAYNESYKQIEVINKKPLPDFDIFLEHSGNSLENIFKNLDLPLEMIQVYRDISLRNMERIILCEGIINILEFLRKKKLYIALSTGKERARTVEILAKFKIIDYFDLIVCSDDVANPKPASDSVEKIHKELGIGNNNGSSIFIGDSVNDILCAKKSKIPCIIVGWGLIDKKTANENFADYYANDMNELKNNIIQVLNIN
jgi:AHBA synthesis associated protein